MSISDSQYNARFPGERLRPVGASRVFTETDDGDVIVDPSLPLAELQNDGPVLRDGEFGETPVGISPETSETIIPRAASLGETLVGFANSSDLTMLADGVVLEENQPGIVNMVTDEGEVVPVDTGTLDRFNVVPEAYEAPVCDALTRTEARQLALIMDSVERLHVLKNGVKLLLEDKPAVDPAHIGDRSSLVEMARLSMLRLAADASWLRNVLTTSHPNDVGLASLSAEISINLSSTEIEKLQRLFIGGKTGSNARMEVLTSEVSKAAVRRGMGDRTATDIVCILGPQGMKFISLIEKDESED